MKAEFTSGSILGHLVRTTLANSVSLLSLYTVEILAMYWLSRKGDAELLAAIGLVGILQFIVISVSLGVSSAMTTCISRYVGAGDADRARTTAAAALVGMACAGVVVAVTLVSLAEQALSFLGAQARVLELGGFYLRSVMAVFPVMALGQITVYVLLAHGRSNRAMTVVLCGTGTVAVLDPLFILGFDGGLGGAALSNAIARVVVLGLGFASVRKLGLLRLPTLSEVALELKGVTKLAVPTVVSNLAPGVATAFVVRQLASFGADVLAGSTVVDRILQFSFGTYFALPGAIAPLLGQNLGARAYDRVRSTLRCCTVLVIAFGVFMSFVLMAASDRIASAFQLPPAGSELVMVFCWAGGFGWTLIGLQFIALPTFNILHKPLYSALVNWSRATVGTAPFVLVGARYGGAPGVLVGQLVGNAVVAVAAFAFCVTFVRRRIEKLRQNQ
jgi:putative MATE family efflux protein